MGNYHHYYFCLRFNIFKLLIVQFATFSKDICFKCLLAKVHQKEVVHLNFAMQNLSVFNLNKFYLIYLTICQIPN